MNKFILFFALLGLVACNSTEKTDVKKIEKKTEEESLIVINGNEYIEYYPGKKKIRTTGMIDDNGERHGVWHYYTEDKIETGTTEYKNGMKHGFSIVRYPNGSLNYEGDYENDKPVGIWKIYDPVTGKVSSTKNYDELNKK